MKIQLKKLITALFVMNLILIISGCSKKEAPVENDQPSEEVQYTDEILLELYSPILNSEKYQYCAFLDINDDEIKELLVTDYVDNNYESYANAVDLFVLKEDEPVLTYDDLWSKYMSLSYDDVNHWIVCVGGGTGTSETIVVGLDEELNADIQKYSVTSEVDSDGNEETIICYNDIRIDEETSDEYTEFIEAFDKMEPEVIKFQTIESLYESEEYIFPESDRRLLTEEELLQYDSETLRLGRNEIFARHGYIFDSKDLKEYFEKQSWYEGTTTPEEFSEHIFNTFEKENVKTIKTVEAMKKQGNLPTADSLDILNQYGYYDSESEIHEMINDDSDYISILSFGATGKILEETDVYYVIEADFYEPISVPKAMVPGDAVEIILDEQTKESMMLDCVKKDRECIWLVDEMGEEYWGYLSSEKDGYVELYYGSDDQILKRIFTDKLAVLKTATDEINILDEINVITKESLQKGFWNCVVFNDKGYAERLIYIGD